MSLFILVFIACFAAHAQDTGDIGAELRALIATGQHPYLKRNDFSRELDIIRSAYTRNQDQPLWTREREVTPQGVRLLQTLRNAGDFGLRPDDYEGTQLIYHAIDLLTDKGAPLSRWAELDLGLSIAAARLVKHLHYGRVDPRAAGFNLENPRTSFDIGNVLAQLAASDDTVNILAQAEPQFLHYRLLKQMLHRYRLLAAENPLPQLPAFKPRSIKPGEAYDGIATLRAILIALGDLQSGAATSDTIMDDTLVGALKTFQQRHGLAADGALGRTTFAALNTPLAARVLQLELTLERWRWLPEFASPPIIVNIPQFRLFAFRSTEDRAADILQMDVIVGKEYPTTRTPIFTAELRYVVFRPYWDVPPSITATEMMPEIRANIGYLEKHNLEIVSSGDSNAAVVQPSPEAMEQLTTGSLRLRQRPGDDNSLGLVKLMLPNPYNVYLHSTPAHRLFNEPRRAFSHGCIRVSDPIALVEHVLRNESAEWTREKIEQAMHDRDNQHVFLAKPIPVLIVYGTAMALENGDVQFFEDLYGHDRKLERLLTLNP